jgi:RHS repeat-associated protein
MLEIAPNSIPTQIATAPKGYTQTLTYNASNQQLASVTDSYGRTLTFTYAASGLLQTLGTPDGRTFTYGYTTTTSAQNLTSVTYPTSPPTSTIYVYENPNLPNTLTGVIDETGNRYAAWTYDAYGRALTSSLGGSLAANLTTIAYNDTTGSRTVTNALGVADTYTVTLLQGVPKVAQISRAATSTTAAATRTFTYDANGFMASSTDWDGNLTTFTHDPRGDETSRVEASGTALARTISTSWLSTFHLPAQITEPNRTTVFTYDANGNMLTKTITAGAATRSFAYSYNATGEVLTAADPRGNVTNYAYDAKGDLTSATDALGHVTSTPSFDANGRPLTIIDPNGVTTSLTYNKRGRLTSQTIGTLKTSYAYDKALNLVQVTQPDASYLTYTYDPAHRLTGIADAAGDHIAYTLDAAGNRIKEQVFDPSGMLSRTRSYAYDALNRLSQTIGALSQTTAYAYDKQNNLTTVTDPVSDAASYDYDALNRLSHGIDPNGGITSYRYDANDHLTGVLDPRNLLTAYAWDGLDDQLQLASPDTGATNKTFDAAGNVISSTDARGNTTTYSYDALNRRTHAAFPDGTSAAWQYDQGANGIGRLSKITDVTGSTSYSYDANGHVTQKKQTAGAVTLMMTYGYDAGGRLASLTYPSGRKVVYAYNAAGRVSSSVTGAGATLAAGVTYLPFGMASGWTAGNGASYQRTIDQDGQITGLALPAGDNIALSYDAASRITGRTETGQPAQNFGYDALDRLASYASGAASQTYTYDANGNRTSYLDNATPPNSLAYNIGPASNRLLGISGSSTESFTYDAGGNMLSYSAPFADYSFSYDARNRQTEAFVGAIGTNFLINGLGQRIAQMNGSVPEFFFVYDEAGHQTGKYDGLGNPLWQTVWLGDLPVAVLSPAGNYYIAPDHLGSPLQITNSTGAVVWQWNFDPFGNGAPAGAFAYELRFPGQFFDQATKLHYNYFRDYDPRLGRYIESDPMGLAGGINTYAYVGGNPLMRTDATGLVTACEAPPDSCDKLLDIDTATCNGITRVRGKRAGAICHASAAERYAECLRDGISGVKTPLATWNN